MNIKNKIGFILILISGLFSGFSLADTVRNIEVFTSSKGAVEQLIEQSKLRRPYIITLHNLNNVEQWEKKFSEGLPANEKEARLEIARKIERMGGQEVFDNQVLDAYAPLARAVEIGLNEYPSVVINGTYVVYGTDSVAVALERYKTWTTNN